MGSALEERSSAAGRQLGECKSKDRSLDVRAKAARAHSACAMTLQIRNHPVPMRHAVGAPVVLTVSHQTLLPPSAGNEYRLFDLVDALSQTGYRCIPLICPLEPSEWERALPALLESQREFVLCNREGTVDAALSRGSLAAQSIQARERNRDWETRRHQALGSFLRGREAPFTSPTLRALLQELCVDLPVRAVIANYAFAAGLLEHAPPKALRIVDTIDVFSRQVLPSGPDPDGRTTTLTEAEERRLLEPAQVVVAIQHVEAEVLRELAPHADVVTCGVSYEFRHVEIDKATHPRIVMLGSGNPMNVAGLRGFLSTVWPTVLRTLPTAELVVGGRLSESLPRWAPNARALGLLDDVAAAYRLSHVVVNPAFRGTGLKVKTVEALSHGRVVICWPAGAEGLEHLSIGTLRTAQDATHMAQLTIEALMAPPPASAPVAAFRRDAVYRDLFSVLEAQACAA